MARDRGRLLALAVAIVVLAAVLWWQFGGPGDPLALPAGEVATTSATGAPVKDVVRPVPAVALSRLGSGAVDASDSGRDPFRFGTGRVAAGRGGRAGAGAMLPPAPVPSPATPPANLAPAGPPPPPPIPLKYIALVVTKRGGIRVAMLSDGRGVYSAVEGAVIEGRYRLVRIGTDSIDVAYLDGRGRRTIPLSGT